MQSSSRLQNPRHIGGDGLLQFPRLGVQRFQFLIQGFELLLEVLVAHLLKTLTGVQGTTLQINDIAGLVGTGNVFANNGELFAAAAQLDLNTNEFASLVGNPVALDKGIYDSAII